MIEKTKTLRKIMEQAPVIPVVTCNDSKQAVELATALVAGGLTSIEVTLRTPNALECIKAISVNVENANVGAGTILSTHDLEAAVNAGSRFMVSPGFSPSLLTGAKNYSVPILFGASSVSDAMFLAEEGHTLLKFFPAVPAGGVVFLSSLYAPLPLIKFCPTGGIGLQNASSFLELPNVLCVGGSWVAPNELIAAGNWGRITELAKQANQMTRV